MAYWVSAQLAEKVIGTKWHVFDIPNGYVPSRAGVVIARYGAWGNRWTGCDVAQDGLVICNKQHGDNWGGTVNAFVCAGGSLTVSVYGDGGLEWFKFMEF
ncbi:TPA: hypothetical protein ACGIMR_000524 [Salmonella enterica subsp. enterica serovar Javiana]